MQSIRPPTKNTFWCARKNNTSYHSCDKSLNHNHRSIPECLQLFFFTRTQSKDEVALHQRSHASCSVKTTSHAKTKTRGVTETALRFRLTRIALGGERSSVQRETSILSTCTSPPTPLPLPPCQRGI